MDIKVKQSSYFTVSNKEVKMHKCKICNKKATYHLPGLEGREYLCTAHAEAKLHITIAYENYRHSQALADIQKTFKESKITVGDVDGKGKKA